jgi:hypothetical protein
VEEGGKRQSTNEEEITANWLSELPDVLSEFRNALAAMDASHAHHSARLSGWDIFIHNYGFCPADTATNPPPVDGFGTVEAVSSVFPPLGTGATKLSPPHTAGPPSADITARILGLPTGKFRRVPTGEAVAPTATAGDPASNKKTESTPVVIFMAEGAAV